MSKLRISQKLHLQSAFMITLLLISGWLLHGRMVPGHGSFLMTVLAVAGLAFLVFNALLHRGMFRKIERIRFVLDQYAQGEFTLDRPVRAVHDELDEVMSHIDRMGVSLSGTLRDVHLQSETLVAVIQEFLALRDVMARDAEEIVAMSTKVLRLNDKVDEEFWQMKFQFDDVKDNSEAMSDAANALSGDILSLSDIAAGTSRNVSKAASATEKLRSSLAEVSQNLNQVNQSVSSVFSSVDGITSSLDSVRDKCRQTSGLSEEAETAAQAASQVMNKLSTSAQDIDKVVEIINVIAEQTNILALNASIEAAGAGDAGKGFAVVANEVKELAHQTAEATQMISDRVQEIQVNIVAVSDANGKVTDRIHKISGANREITDLVGSQHATLSGIADSLENVSQASDAVTRRATEMENTANSVSQATQEAATGTREIASMVNQTSDAAQKLARDGEKSQKVVARLSTLGNDIFKASADIQLHGMKGMRLINYITGSIHHSGLLTQVVKENSDNLRRLVEGTQIGEPPFDVKAVKLAHLGWLGKLEHVIRGRSQLKAKEVASGHECAFGKWYDSEGTELFGQMHLFQQVGVVHMKVHELAREVVALANRNLIQEAVAKMEDFNKLRKELFKGLDEVYTDDEAISLRVKSRQ